MQLEAFTYRNPSELGDKLISIEYRDITRPQLIRAFDHFYMASIAPPGIDVVEDL